MQSEHVMLLRQLLSSREGSQTHLTGKPCHSLHGSLNCPFHILKVRDVYTTYAVLGQRRNSKLGQKQQETGDITIIAIIERSGNRGNNLGD